MRTITIDNNEFEVRPLTRGEVKALRKEGYNLTALNSDVAEEAVDRVFGMIFDETKIAAIDALPNPEALKLWTGILKETYGAPGEAKNFLPSGKDSQTA